MLFATCCKAQKTPLGKPGQIYHISANGNAEYADPSYSLLNLIPPTNGTNGTSFINGSGVPASTVGNNGDTYLDFVALNIYTKAAGVWTLRNNIKGAQGIQGIAGLQGPIGLTGQTGIAGIQGPQGMQGIQGPAGPPGPAGTGGITGLPTTGNQFDILTWYNGKYVLLPGNPRWQADATGVTTGLNLGSVQIDPNWTDYNPSGFIKINSITAGSSVSINFLYTDLNGVTVTYNVPFTTVGMNTLDLTKVIQAAAFTPGGLQIFTTVTGNVNYDVRATINLAP